MYKGKRIAAVVVARAGSKRLPRKNVRLLGSRPLIGWTFESAAASIHLDRILLSTDDDEVIEIAKEYGVEVPFKRPAELSNDLATSVDVVCHVAPLIQECDYLILLQPTSPFRSGHDIDVAVEMCIDASAQSCVSLQKVDCNSDWAYKVKEGSMEKLVSDGSHICELNGAIYMVEINLLLKDRKLMYQNSLPYLMPGERSIDIDTLDDFMVAEKLLKGYDCE